MIPILFYGDQIIPGTSPVLIFPIVANHIELSVNLASVLAGTITGSTEGPLTLTGTDTENGTPPDLTDISTLIPPQLGAVGNINCAPIASQLSNLNVKVSKDGGAFSNGTGTLSEITSGYYKYVPATTETNNPPTSTSSNAGSVLFRFYPTNPRAVVNYYIEETVVVIRLRASGSPSVILNPGSGQNLVGPGGLIQPTIDDLKNFIRSAIRDLLGNQLTNKPTFKRDS